MLVWGQYLPYTHSHMTPTVKGGTVETAVGAGGVGETGLGRQKIEEKRARKNKRTSWEAAQQKGKPQQKRSVIPFEQLRHPEILLKG